jgi:outer membrane immunogenic protein
MRTLLLAAVAAAGLAATPAFAQDVPADTTDTTTAAPAPEPTAPDGSRAFGIEPYFGIMGGYERFDDEVTDAGIPVTRPGSNYDGGLVQGVVGFNVPLGPVFVGAEGNVAKGFKGDIDWEYGAAGRFGFRAGDSGLFYGKVGYQWVNFDAPGTSSRDYHEMTYGIGAEVGPKDIGLGGLTGNSGVRFRLEVNTFGSAHSIQPLAGLVAHF